MGGGQGESGREERSSWLTGCEASHITVASTPKSVPRRGWEGENGVGGIGDREKGSNKKRKKKKGKGKKKKSWCYHLVGYAACVK